MKTLGFVGLGVMGEPMCANLLRKSGSEVWGFDVNEAPLARLAEHGLKRAASLADLADRAEVIFLSLPSITHVEEVILGAGGLMENPGRLKMIVDMSTSSVERSRALAEKLAEMGISFVDAPVARMRKAAIDGTLAIMVGGTADQFAMVEPWLSCMGSDIVHCGGIGNGQVVKILNNMVVFMTVNALAEAIAIGRRAGVDGEMLFDVMSKGSADSFALRTPGKSLSSDSFPEQTFPTVYALKDIALALELAQQGGIDASAARHTHDLMERSRDAGFDKAYYPAMVRLIEGRA